MKENLLLKDVFNNSLQFTVSKAHGFLLIEHLFYSAIKLGVIDDLLKDKNIDKEELLMNINKYLDDNVDLVNKTFSENIIISIPLQNIISQLRVNDSTVEEFMYLSYKERDIYIIDLLNSYNINKNYFAKLLPSIKKSNEKENIQEEKEDYDRTKEEFPNLYKFGANLNTLVKNDKINNIIGRKEEVQKICQVLTRKTKNNCILLGDPGVGKTAVIEKLAHYIVKEPTKVPKQLRDKIIFSIDTNSLIAGATYRGDFERNMKKLIEEAKNEKVILFIDEYHTLFGLGSSNDSRLDATNILKPYLARNEINFIGATTYEDAKKTVFKNKAMERRFQKVDILEPSKEETLFILENLKTEYENFYNIKYPSSILSQIVNLTGKFISDRNFPDKAIDVLDEIGSHRNIKNKRSKTVGIKEVENIISQMAKVPVTSESNTNKEILKLENNLEKNLFGQEKSIKEVVEQIILQKAGLNEDNKPAASFLLSGPSGTGKTELARLLSKNLGMKLLRYDMGEFNDKTSVNRLFGSNAGYVGYEEGGTLINDVVKHPNSVILFDEIEKADSSVMNGVLQILEEAEATSGNNMKASFKNCIILFTTNAGSQTHIEKNVGFFENKIENQNTALNDVFSPEFRNRLNGILHFNSLEKSSLEQIIIKFLNETEEILKEKNITFKMSKKAIEFFIKEGYNENMGARPMKRVIEKHIKKPLSILMIKESLKDTIVTIDLDKDNNEKVLLTYK